MAIDIIYNEEVRERIMAGIDKLANAVKITLGPKGRNCVMYIPEEGDNEFIALKKGILPTVTNDGVTIAKNIILKDPVEDLGAMLIYEAALRANEVAGDGTTTATLLTQGILKEGFKTVAAGANPLEVRNGIKKAADFVISELKNMAKPVDTIEMMNFVATVSCQEEELGKIIASAVKEVGVDGLISLSDTGLSETRLEIQKGITYDKGYKSELLVTDKEEDMVEVRNPLILMTDHTIASTDDIIGVLKMAIKEKRALLIICDNMEKEEVGFLVANMKNNNLGLDIILNPGTGEGRKRFMEDLAIQTGGKFISKDDEMLLSNVEREDLGSCDYVKTTRTHTFIEGGHGDKERIAMREREIRKDIDNENVPRKLAKLEERLSKFTSGMAVIKVGGKTEVEIRDRKLRAEDAVNAVKAAMLEGIVAGGGTAYIDTIKALEKYIETLSKEEQIGARAVRNAIMLPAEQIAENAGFDGKEIASKVKSMEPGIGFDAMTEDFVDMIKAGIIDPVKVSRLALTCAASVSSTMLTTQATIFRSKLDIEPPTTKIDGEDEEM